MTKIEQTNELSGDLSFVGKNVVVVGGTSGINRAIAEAFAKRGASVAVASRSQENVDDTVASLSALGAPSAIGQSFDVRNFEDVEAGIKAIHEALGDIDILVSGAAGNFPAFAADMSVRAFSTVVNIDLMGTVHVLKAAHPYLKRPGSSILNITAPQSYLPYETQSHVGAAKAGVDQITRTFALEWGYQGIRVNSVSPGFIADTEGAKRLGAESEIGQIAIEDTPLGRLGQTQDVANLCLFLASDLAGFVTGQVIEADGGLYLRGSGRVGSALAQMVRAQSEQG